MVDGMNLDSKDWLFICGLTKSGTTLLANCVNLSEDVSFLLDPGGKILEGQWIQDIYDWGWGRGSFSRQYHMTEVHPPDADFIRERLLKCWLPHWNLSSSILADKSPHHLMRSRWLQGLFPGAHFIFIVRNALVRATGEALQDGSSPLERCREWVEGNRVMEEDLPHLQNYLIIRYEDLTNFPKETMERICGFLEIPYVEIRDKTFFVHAFLGGIQRPDHNPIRDMNLPHLINFAYALDPGTRKEMIELCAPLLDRLGYSTDLNRYETYKDNPGYYQICNPLDETISRSPYAWQKGGRGKVSQVGTREQRDFQKDFSGGPHGVKRTQHPLRDHPIAVVTETLDYVSGGVRCIVEVLNRLSRRGFETACYVTAPSLSCSWLDVEFPIRPISEFQGFDGIAISPYSPTAQIVAASRARGKFYWVHTYEPAFADITPRGPGWRDMSERSYSLDELQYMAASTYVRMILRHIYGRDVLTTLVPGGVDCELFRPSSRSGGVPRIVFLSREHAFRGMDDVLRALKMAKDIGIEFEAIAIGKPLDSGDVRIRSMPFLPQPDYAAILGSADIFIHASHFEGLPLPPLEAMACKCAVISTYVGASDYLLDGYNALVVPPGRPDKIRDALARLMEEPDLRAQLSENGHRTVVEGYTWEHTVDRLVEALEEGLERMRSNGPLGMAVDAGSGNRPKGLTEMERVSPVWGDTSHRGPIEVHESKPDKTDSRFMGADGNWLGKPLYIRPAGPGGLQEVNGVKGFLRVEDIHFLYRKANQLPQGAVVVEIGSFMGLSAIVMAHGMMEAGNSRGRIFCVDTWEGSREHLEMEEVRRGDLFEEFNRNVLRTGVSEYIVPVRKTSVEAAEDFEVNSVDMVFIDGDHSYEGCLQDLRAWFPKVRPGGILLGHDCTPQGTVRKALEDLCDEFKLRFTVHEPPNAHFIFEIRKPGNVGSPLVSAIVSTYNAERFIRGCLEDLEGQTIADRLEIIVVDSGSRQNERTVVEEFRRRHGNITYIRTEHRESVYAAWNRAIKAARGRYITNANTDDRHRRDALEVLARALDENPDVALAYADFLVTERENETFDTCEPVDCVRLPEHDPQLLVRLCYVGPQPMWRRELHDQYGYFDETFECAGDYEFWLRMAKGGEKFLHVRQTLGLYLRSPNSLENSDLQRARMESNRARLIHFPELESLILRQGETEDAGTSMGATHQRSLIVDEALEWGEQLARVGCMAEAKETYWSLREEGVTHWRVGNDLACILWQGGDLQGALRELISAVEEHPDEETVLENCLEVLRALGRESDCKALLKRLSGMGAGG